MHCEAVAPRARMAFTVLEVILVVAILFLTVLVLIPAFRTAKPLQLAPESTPEPIPAGALNVPPAEPCLPAEPPAPIVKEPSPEE